MTSTVSPSLKSTPFTSRAMASLIFIDRTSDDSRVYLPSPANRDRSIKILFFHHGILQFLRFLARGKMSHPDAVPGFAFNFNRHHISIITFIGKTLGQTFRVVLIRESVDLNRPFALAWRRGFGFAFLRSWTRLGLRRQFFPLGLFFCLGFRLRYFRLLCRAGLRTSLGQRIVES